MNGALTAPSGHAAEVTATRPASVPEDGHVAGHVAGQVAEDAPAPEAAELARLVRDHRQ